MFCPKCGKEIKDTAKFCNFCGESMALKVNPCTDNLLNIQPHGDNKRKSFKDYFRNICNLNRIKNTGKETAIYSIDKKSYKRIMIFSIISFVFLILSIGCLFFKIYANYVDNIESSVGFIKYFFANATILDYGIAIVSPTVSIISGILFIVFCGIAKNKKAELIIIPQIITVSYSFVWNVVLEVSVYMGFLRNYTVNWLVTILVCLCNLLFIVIFIFSLNGKIKYSLLAKVLTLLLGSFLVITSFANVYGNFIGINEFVTTTYGIAYVILGLLSSLFAFFSYVLTILIKFIFVFSMRRKLKNYEESKDENKCFVRNAVKN